MLLTDKILSESDNISGSFQMTYSILKRFDFAQKVKGFDSVFLANCFIKVCICLKAFHAQQ